MTITVGDLRETVVNVLLLSSCFETEVVPEDALLDHDWDETRVEEATGNEGAMMERWYHHAALIIWPHSKHWDILCANNLGRAVKVRKLQGPPHGSKAKRLKKTNFLLEEGLRNGSCRCT